MPSKASLSKPQKSQPSLRTKKYSTFPNETLQHLSDQGDLNAKVILADRQIVQGMVQEAPKRIRNHSHSWKPGSPPPETWSVGLDDSKLYLQFEQDNKGNPEINMYLAIDESTTLEKIKQQWDGIRTWRDFLKEWQGPPRSRTHEDDVLFSLHKQHKKLPYSKIAESLNAEIQNDLKAALKQKRLWASAAKRLRLPSSPDNAQDREAILREAQKHGYGNGLALDQAAFKLIPLGFTYDHALQACEQGLRKLKNTSSTGINTFTPISKDQVRERLRAWREKHQTFLNSKSR